MAEATGANVMEKPPIKSWIMTVLCVAVVAALIWKLVSGRLVEEPPVEPPVVTVAEPVVKDVTSYDYFTGTTESVASVEIRTRLEGFLESVEFAPSADVKTGDVLFIVEPELYQAQRDKAEARLRASVAEAEKAESELQRVELAIKSNAVSEQEVTSKRAQRDKAKAAVKASEATLAEAELQLSYTKILTPIDGRVSRNLVDAGNLVGAGEKTLLTTVVAMDPIHVYFNVSERIVLERLSKRAEQGYEHVKEEHHKFAVGVSSENDYPYIGELDYIDNVVDPSTGTISVRGVIDNENEVLLPGMFVRVRLPAGIKKDAVLVAETALGTDIGGKYLFIVGADNIVEQRPVEIGALVESERVIEKGIEPGELYITEGLLRARPGLPVKYNNGHNSTVCRQCQKKMSKTVAAHDNE